MLKVLSEEIDSSFLIRRYTKDGNTVSHTVKSIINEPKEPIEPSAPKPTLEEQILAENQYQTALLEMQMLGGM